MEAGDISMLIVAGPGTGKTRVLTHRIAYLVQSRGFHASRILALTFTNKAAREMKERVEELLKVPGQATPSVYPMPWCGTFHSFCARLLRKHGHLANLPKSWMVLDNKDQRHLLQSILAELPPESPWSTATVPQAISILKNRCCGVADLEAALTSSSTSPAIQAKSP